MGSVASWTEAILLSLVFVALLTIMVSNFNIMYDKNYVTPFQDNSQSENLFINYQDTAQQQIKGGEVDFNAEQGITLKSSFGLARDSMTIVWNFITGGWIEQVIGTWNLGESGTALAKGLRIIYFLSLVFALLYALFKVVL